MALETETEVEQITTVLDEQGNPESPANEKQQQRVAEAAENKPAIGGFVHTTSSTDAEQLPAHDVPHGVDVVVQTRAANADNIYIGNSEVQPLEVGPNSGATFRVTDTSALYVRAASAGDVVGVIFEEDA